MRTQKDKPALRKILDLAKAERDKLTALLAQGDLNEEQFRLACDRLAKMVIVQAAVSSMEVMK